MTAKKAPTKILAYDHEDRDAPAPREFKPCSTCQHQMVFKNQGSAGCGMFGYEGTRQARASAHLCGRYGDAWEPKKVSPGDYAATPMVERILG